MSDNQILKDSSSVYHKVVENLCLAILDSQGFGPIKSSFFGIFSSDLSYRIWYPQFRGFTYHYQFTQQYRSEIPNYINPQWGIPITGVMRNPQINRFIADSSLVAERAMKLRNCYMNQGAQFQLVYLIPWNDGYELIDILISLSLPNDYGCWPRD